MGQDVSLNLQLLVSCLDHSLHGRSCSICLLDSGKSNLTLLLCRPSLLFLSSTLLSSSLNHPLFLHPHLPPPTFLLLASYLQLPLFFLFLIHLHLLLFILPPSFIFLFLSSCSFSFLLFSSFHLPLFLNFPSSSSSTSSFTSTSTLSPFYVLSLFFYILPLHLHLFSSFSFYLSLLFFLQSTSISYSSSFSFASSSTSTSTLPPFFLLFMRLLIPVFLVFLYSSFLHLYLYRPPFLFYSLPSSSYSLYHPLLFFFLHLLVIIITWWWLYFLTLSNGCSGILQLGNWFFFLSFFKASWEVLPEWEKHG